MQIPIADRFGSYSSNFQSVADTQAPFDDQDGLHALRNNDSPMGRGVRTMSDMMGLLNVVANNLMDGIERKMKISQDAQNMSNEMEAVIAKINDPTKDTQSIPQDVIDYMTQDGITVDGKSIMDFLGGDAGKQLNKADLMNVKNALDGQQTEASNFVQTSQLKIQQVMQTYNVATQMVNSLLSMGAEMNKAIASSIR